MQFRQHYRREPTEKDVKGLADWCKQDIVGEIWDEEDNKLVEETLAAAEKVEEAKKADGQANQIRVAPLNAQSSRYKPKALAEPQVLGGSQALHGSDHSTKIGAGLTATGAGVFVLKQAEGALPNFFNGLGNMGGTGRELIQGA